VTLLQSILLGLLQGATEFLPVSSSGHLLLAQHLFGIREPELAFDLLLHLGTLVAVLFFLRAEIASIVSSRLSVFPSTCVTVRSVSARSRARWSSVTSW